MLKTWKRSADKDKVFDALLTDLAKPFNCLDHELFIAKLNEYGFRLPALRLINKNREKTENTHRKWLDIIFSVPQGSTLGPLPLVFIFLADLLLAVHDMDIASYFLIPTSKKITLFIYLSLKHQRGDKMLKR